MKCNRSGKAEKMKLFFLLIFMLMLICGCGSSGGDEPRVVRPDKPSEPDISDFAGTYELEGFSLTQVSTGSKGSNSNAEYWCGRMVISSGNRILFDFLLNDAAYTFDLEIVEIAKDHFLVDRNGCEVQIDYVRDGNKLSIMWPADRCLLDDFALDWEFSLQNNSQDYPPADSCPMPDSDTDTDTDTNDIDLVGTYEMVRYQITDSSEGSVVEGEEPDDGWSGQMTINTSNIIDIRMTVGEENLRSTWEILDDDGDGLSYVLVVEDQNDCQTTARITFSSENENILVLAIGFPGDRCTDGLMTFAFNRTDNTVSLKNSIRNNLESVINEPGNQRDIIQIVKDKTLK